MSRHETVLYRKSGWFLEVGGRMRRGRGICGSDNWYYVK